MYFVDMTGERYGKLVVLKRGKRNDKRGLYEWICQCDCGNIKSVVGKDMKNGNTNSCGCMSSRNFAGERTKTHGMSNDKLYNVWRSMKSRCTLPSQKSYKDYGGRGITVCEEWVNDFVCFYEWSVDNGYKDGLTIDRIDNDGNYEPTNCKWSTRTEQQKNKRNTKLYTVFGIVGNKTELVRHFGISRTTLRRRIESGMSVEEAFIDLTKT